MANYSLGIKPLPDVENGHTFRGDNFTQLLPNTVIFEGKSGLTFVNCNLINCDANEDSVLVGCLNVQLSFCTNLNPKYIEKGLSPCAENCSHVVDSDTVTIDGVLVDTIYHYQDTVI